MSPTLSVVIPVFNGAAFIGQAIESVLRVAVDGVEIIVVDDGSTDATASVVRAVGAPVRYVRQDNQGPPVARNAGIREASGELIALLDADDLWPADKLRHQRPPLLENPALDLVLGYTRHFRETVGPDGTARMELAEPMMIVQLGAALFRRRVFDEVGLFDPRLPYGDDVDWLLRAREKRVGVALVEEVGILYRRHSNNMTLAAAPPTLSLAAMLKRSLDRRRAGGANVDPMARWFDDLGAARRR
jgi:glycosyltransferase involved in cell wall biosynthesis